MSTEIPKVSVVQVGAATVVTLNRSNDVGPLAPLTPLVTPREMLAFTAAQLLETLGYTAIHARAPGYESPITIKGSISDQTPDVSAVSASGAAIILDCVPALEVGESTTESRWTLFVSAAVTYGFVFEIMTEAYMGSGDDTIFGTEVVRERLRALGLKSASGRGIHVWSL